MEKRSKSKRNRVCIVNDTYPVVFYNCSKLTTIYADQKIFGIVKRGYAVDMFYGCVSLPNFDANNVDNTNAHTDANGYLTYKAKTN